MNKKKKSKIEARKKVFDNIKIGKKELLLNKRIKSSRQIISKSKKIMKDINYGKDLDYQQYMLYLDKLREKQEMDLKYNSEKDKIIIQKTRTNYSEKEYHLLTFQINSK